MTVNELIEVLKKCPPTSIVVIGDAVNGAIEFEDSVVLSDEASKRIGTYDPHSNPLVKAVHVWPATVLSKTTTNEV